MSVESDSPESLLADKNFFDGGSEVEEDYQIQEYDLVSSPNDFNIKTIFDFVDSGVVTIPGFQRNYVWDIKRASKLIESLILGLPIPQIFLYEEERNSFLVIDGQQRLMSIYYFVKQRFPRRDKRSELRQIFEDYKRLDDEVLQDDRYFTKFSLQLPKLPSSTKNQFAGLNYSTLGEYKQSFDLRTIRNVIVKQVVPRDDDSSIHEIFNRLNSGGVNLSPQEMRGSLYHSNFYDLLFQLNQNEGWRNLLNMPVPDLRMKDIEVLLRSFALLINGQDYRSSMARFLDKFSKEAKSYSQDKITYLGELFESFVLASHDLPPHAFLGESGKFNIPLFESVFAAVCRDPLLRESYVTELIDPGFLSLLTADSEFFAASEQATTNKGNVDMRLRRARELKDSRANTDSG